MSNFSIVDDLLQHSMDAGISVSQLVKYCSVLADDIDDAEMAKWCEEELYGHEVLPDYRKVYGRLTAQDIYNRTTPVAFENHTMSELYSTVNVRISIGDIEDMVKSTKPGRSYQFMFPDKFAQELIKNNRHVISVYWVVQIQTLSKIVEHVRNYVFKWAKGLKKSGIVPSGSYPKLGAKDKSKGESQITINAASLNTAAIGSGTTFSNSPIQVASVNSTQSIQYDVSDFSELNIKLDELLTHLSTAKRTQENDQLVDEINSLKNLLSQPKLRSSWVTETLETIKGIIENATGSALATYADKAAIIQSIGTLLGLS